MNGDKTASVPVTPRQRQVLDYLREYQAEHGYSATVREIQAHLGISSPNGVMCHLKSLEIKGLLRRGARGLRRVLRVVDQQAAPVQPIHDRVIDAARRLVRCGGDLVPNVDQDHAEIMIAWAELVTAVREMDEGGAA